MGAGPWRAGPARDRAAATELQGAEHGPVAGKTSSKGRGTQVAVCGGGAWAWSGRSQGTGLSCQRWSWRDQAPVSWSLELFGECWLLSPLPGATRLPGPGVLSLPGLQLLRGGGGAGENGRSGRRILCCILACSGMHWKAGKLETLPGAQSRAGAQTREAE